MSERERVRERVCFCVCVYVCVFVFVHEGMSVFVNVSEWDREREHWWVSRKKKYNETVNRETVQP